MISGEALTPSIGFDAVRVGLEALPEGVFASDAEMSVIKEVRDLFHPGSPNFESAFDRARQDTRQRHIEAAMAALRDAAAQGSEAAALELEIAEVRGLNEVVLMPSDPDPDIYEREALNRDARVQALKNHADVTGVPYTGGMATFVVITGEGRCIYGIGPEQPVRDYLGNAGYLINCEYVDGKPSGGMMSSTTNRRPAMPDPFAWYANHAIDYPGPLDKGSYIDVVQRVDMAFVSPSDE